MNTQTTFNMSASSPRPSPFHRLLCGLLFLAGVVGALLGPTAQIHAAPVFGKVMSVRQPDGTLARVRIWGDEYYGLTETLDGYTLVRDRKTWFLCYARLSADGNDLVSTGVAAGKGRPETLGLKPHLRIKSAAARTKARQARARNALVPPAALKGPVQILGPTAGNVTGITLLVEFPDEAHTISRSEVDAYCNQTGYTGFGNNGSVRDYFYDVSYQQLTYTNYVAPYYEAAHEKAYYTDPTVEWGDRSRSLALEALTHLDASGFDFSAYDADNNGTVDAVNVYYVGDHNNNWAEGLWPGAFGFDLWLDGVHIGKIQVTDMSSQLTLGTFCHENGHMLLNWPDLYDYDEPGPDDSAGAGKYCIMCNGVSDTNPVQPCGYLKVRAGWCNVHRLESAEGRLVASINSNTVYIFYNPATVSEYYLIENRQKTGRDAFLPDAGLAIWHIDRFGSNNNQEMLPDLHYEATVVQADGLWDLEYNVNWGDSTDLWGAPDFPRCTPDTIPNTHWWDGSASGLYIEEISVSGPTMTFTFGFAPSTWVDFGYTGLFEFGTFEFPYDTLAEGVDAVADEGILWIKSGSTLGSFTVSKPMTIDNFGGDVFIGQ